MTPDAAYIVTWAPWMLYSVLSMYLFPEQAFCKELPTRRYAEIVVASLRVEPEADFEFECGCWAGRDLGDICASICEGAKGP